MFPRHTGALVAEALGRAPVAMIVGPRQAGKTTLAQSLVSKQFPARYVTLDRPETRDAVAADLSGFVYEAEPLIIDEVQHVPDLLSAIKVEVDRDRRPGRFLLTGSANVLLLPRVSESLAGRMELRTLWPLSQGEIESKREGFVARLFSGERTSYEHGDRVGDLTARLMRGGFPEVVQSGSARDRDAWLDSYVTTLIQRDIRDLSNIERLDEVPRILKLLAARATGPLDKAGIARQTEVPQTTLQRYLTLLHQLFLIQLVPAWYRNIGRRLLKRPKLLIADTALMANLLGLSEQRLESDRDRLGPLLENFVGMELIKQATWSEPKVSVLHYRTEKGHEVDFLLEDRSGRVAAVEVKATATPGRRDFAAMRSLAERLGDQFVAGIVLYTGDAYLPFGDRLAAWPIDALWAGDPVPADRDVPVLTAEQVRETLEQVRR